MRLPLTLSAAETLGAVVLNTSWLPGLIEGLVGAVIIFALAAMKRWGEERFSILVHQTTANGLTSDTSGDTSKRTENAVAVLFRVVLATTDTTKLPAELQDDVRNLQALYSEGK